VIGSPRLTFSDESLSIFSSLYAFRMIGLSSQDLLARNIWLLFRVCPTRFHHHAFHEFQRISFLRAPNYRIFLVTFMDVFSTLILLPHGRLTIDVTHFFASHLIWATDKLSIANLCNVELDTFVFGLRRISWN